MSEYTVTPVAWGKEPRTGMVDPTPSERNTQTNTTLLFVGGVALYLLFGIALWWALDQYIDPESAKVPSTAKKDLFQGWGFIMAGVAAGVGIYFTWRSQRLGYETLRSELQDFQQRAEVNQELMQMNQERLRLTHEGMQMQNFAIAVQQLGALDEKGRIKFENRLGAIYSLEGLAKSSETLHSAILRMLTGYVREHAPLLRPRVELEESPLGEYGRADPAMPAVPRLDIQAILDVLGRRAVYSVPEQNRVTLDLGSTDLRGAHLQGNFSGVRFYKAELRGARLQQSNLQEADLQSANLSGPTLEGANIFGADLSGANLSEVRGLTQEQLVWVVGNDETELPKGLDRPKLWSKSSEEQRKIIQEQLHEN